MVSVPARRGQVVYVSTGTEVSPNVGFQNSLVRRVWYRAVISRRCDRICPLRVDGRGVWVLPAAW